MKAIQFYDFNEFKLEDVPTPTPDGTDVLIEVNNVQLSITECKRYRGEKIAGHEVLRERLKDAPIQLFGHEFSGTVVETGNNVTQVEIGDRVYAPGKIACNVCSYCRNGYPNLCSNKKSIGRHYPGALAEYIRLPETPLCVIPDGVSNAEGAALQPMASSLLSVVDADIQMGDVVVIMGTGVMGYQCGQISRLMGASKVFAVDVDDEKLRIAEKHGMIPIDATTTDPAHVVTSATENIGADVVFEAVGGDQNHVTDGTDPLAQSFDMVRYGGKVVQVSHIVGEAAIKPRALRSKSVRWINPLKGVFSTGPNTNTGRLAAELVSNDQVSISEYISDDLNGLADFERAVDMTVNKGEYGLLGPTQIVVSS
jgi:threonine dehydrogenase-like Zn-dependent dehydrogenase